ncbi:hypothetical protein L1987_40146 [Smallanthus sonchifolius]|uniref:Uncharacterized protein n=1 Tax=Smallanthus sonchifolius TaxID=185202 RepID=A0ACB9GU01_9ASTR|nr:hypothetical protein L1987_40146 [Smallanthus sonchifolius]
MLDFGRVQKELQECNKYVNLSGISIDIDLPDAYPFEPPKMKFATKVCLIPKALLSTPELDDPQDAVVAQQYLKDYQVFASTARYWTESFAKTSSLGVEEKVQKLVEMGFPEGLVRSTLEAVGGDENLALEKLCSG